MSREELIYRLLDVFQLPARPFMVQEEAHEVWAKMRFADGYRTVAVATDHTLCEPVDIALALAREVNIGAARRN